MKLAILGTRGIPNHHGGFEQFAEYLSQYLVKKGHEVSVYNSHSHPYQEPIWRGVKIIHKFDPEKKTGTVGQFIYDFNCIMDSRKSNFDIILQLGYTSSSVWSFLFPKGTLVVTNMDGLEWKRTKYNGAVRAFLKFAEKIAAQKSHYIIADSIGIQDYIKRTYGRGSQFIAYGADIFSTINAKVLKRYNVCENKYNMLIARLEPENSIETIIIGYINSQTDYPLLVFGSLNSYGLALKTTYSHDARIHFVGANYNIDELNNLRYFSRYYFHGHTVGGTNPSLLEAMASSALIIAHDNIFNRSILNSEAAYFSEASDITKILDKDEYFKSKNPFMILNQKKIENNYSWDIINTTYEKFFLDILKK